MSIPKTIGSERRRQQEGIASKQLFRTLQASHGEIVSVSDKGRGMIQARFNNGTLVAGGTLIPIINSPEDIVHRYGQLREGLTLMIFHSGDTDTHAFALVLGEQEDKPGAPLLTTNDIEVGLFEIFL